MHQSFQGLEVTEELLDSSTSIVFTVNSNKAEGEPGALVLRSFAIAVREDLVISFLIPGPTLGGQLDAGVNIHVFLKLAADTRVNNRHLLGVLKLRTQQLAVHTFSCDNLSEVTVTISLYNVAVQGVHLHTVLAHVEQGVTSDHQMLDCREDLNTISRSSNAFHDHTFDLCKA